MNGDEDLGQDITMKGQKFHYNQFAQQLPLCNGENGVHGVDCVSTGNYPRKLSGRPYAPSGEPAGNFVSGAHSYESNGRHDYMQLRGIDGENDTAGEDAQQEHHAELAWCTGSNGTPGVDCRRDKREGCAGNTLPEGVKADEAKCRVLPACTDTLLEGCFRASLAQKKSKDGEEKDNQTEEDQTEAAVELAWCNGSNGTPGVDCRKDTREGCAKNTLPEGKTAATAKCKILPVCTADLVEGCYKLSGTEMPPAAFAQMSSEIGHMHKHHHKKHHKSKDGEEKDNQTEEDQTEPAVELAWCSVPPAEGKVPGVDCRKDTRDGCPKNTLPEGKTAATAKCRVLPVCTADLSEGCYKLSGTEMPASLAQKKSKDGEEKDNQTEEDQTEPAVELKWCSVPPAAGMTAGVDCRKDTREGCAGNKLPEGKTADNAKCRILPVCTPDNSEGCYRPQGTEIAQVQLSSSHRHHHKKHHHHRSKDGEEKDNQTEEDQTEPAVELKWCNGSNGTPGVDCRKETREGCAGNKLPEGKTADNAKCRILPACTADNSVDCFRASLAQKKSKDGEEKDNQTEEDQTEPAVELAWCSVPPAEGKVPGVDCRKDTREGCPKNTLPEGKTAATAKCRVLPVCTADLSEGCYKLSGTEMPASLAQGKHHHKHHKKHHKRHSLIDVSLAPNLPKCNGANGVLGVDCVSAAGYPKKLDEPIPIGGLAQLPTCDQWITTNCQPVCTRDLTVGCTEERTPERPKRDRFEGKWTHKPQQTTIQARVLPTDGTSNTMPNPYPAPAF